MTEPKLVQKTMFAARLPTTIVKYGSMLKHAQKLCQLTAGTAVSVWATGAIIKMVRLAQNGELTEATSEELVNNSANVFSGKKRKKFGNSSTESKVPPFDGRQPGPGAPLQQRIRGQGEPPAPSKKKDPSCGFCGSTMRTGKHSRINICPEVKAIGTLVQGGSKGEKHVFARKLLDGSIPCDDISSEDRSRLQRNHLESLPRSAKFICVHRHFAFSTNLSADALYLVKNRAAEVTMYGDGGLVLEGYDRVAASVTAVNTWINKNRNSDNAISAMPKRVCV
jgi:hypothetical protein